MSKDSELKLLKQLLKKIEERDLNLVAFNSNQAYIEKCNDIINGKHEFIFKNAEKVNNYNELEQQYIDKWKERYTCSADKIYSIAVSISITLFIIWFILGLALASNKSFPNDAWFFNIKICSALIFGVPLTLASIFYITKKIKYKNVAFSRKQKKELENAKSLDEKNIETNKNREAIELKTFNEKRKQDVEQTQNDLKKFLHDNEKLAKQIEDLNNEINKNDCLAEADKVAEIVSLLVYYIETKRADSIKEALLEYDKTCHNEKQLQIEREKLNLEKAKVKKEQADRQQQLQQEHAHQQNVEAQMIQAAIDREETSNTLKRIELDTRYNAYFKDKQ